MRNRPVRKSLASRVPRKTTSGSGGTSQPVGIGTNHWRGRAVRRPPAPCQAVRPAPTPSPARARRRWRSRCRRVGGAPAQATGRQAQPRQAPGSAPDPRSGRESFQSAIWAGIVATVGTPAAQINGARLAQRPRNVGARLSTKACIASRVSAVARFTDWAVASSSSACSSVIPTELLSSRLVWARAIGGPAASRRAQSATKSSSSASATTRLTSPSASASLRADDVGEQGELLGPVHADPSGQDPGPAEVDAQPATGEDLRETSRFVGDDEVAHAGPCSCRRPRRPRGPWRSSAGAGGTGPGRRRRRDASCRARGAVARPGPLSPGRRPSRSRRRRR